MAVYSCTADASCGESFTTNKDWHRHDSTQHYYRECWLCTEPSSSSSNTQCLQVFYTSSAYESHLLFQHKIVELEQHPTEVHRLGPNASSRFWCGFCAAIVELTEPRADAWLERWQHMEAHFASASCRNTPYVHYIASE